MSYSMNARFPHTSLFAAALCAAALLAACPGTDEPIDDNGMTSNSMMNNSTSNNTMSCSNLCLAGETKCLNDSVALTCTEQADGCRNFGSPERCGSNEMCMAGECVPSGSNNDAPNQCTSTCTNGDPPICKNGQVVTCADHDNNGCLSYGNAMECTGDTVCQGGMCVEVTCENPCTEGTARCDGELLQTCETNPKTGCLEFTPGNECAAGQTCMGDACVEEINCEDECPAGEKLCGPGGTPRACEDSDGDGCVEYVDKAECGAGQECRGGECIEASTCEDQCTAMARVCVGSEIQECRDTDGDGCVEFDLVEDCANGGFICDDSGAVQCTTAPMTGQVVINEIFYNPAGADFDATNDESSSFIELAGPPGFDVSGYEVRLVNGSNGMPYQTITIPQGSVIDGYGFVLITTDKPDSFLTFGTFGNFVLPEISTSGNTDGIQNGPDNVELYDDSGTKLDALGYGDFDTMAGDVFTGEGMPAGNANGRSLGRLPGAADTDNNSVDFLSLFPTPGLPNGDLIINEVYVDQPGTDGVAGQIETFIELTAPIRGWVDMELSGYKIRAINGLDGTDYIFEGADPGANLAGFALNDVPGSEGFVTLCNIDASVSLFDYCSAIYEGPDFQNGPDSIVLEYRGRVLDAVGYGSFSGTDVFAGEGSAASLTSSNSGKSLNRWPTSDPSKDKDTDNNATDFHLAEPSPGKGNKYPPAP